MTRLEPQIVAGWAEHDKSLKVYKNLQAALQAHPEVLGCWPEETFVKLGYTRIPDGDDGYEWQAPEGLTFTYAQARELVNLVNSEGNYHEFVLRPAWPDEEIV